MADDGKLEKDEGEWKQMNACGNGWRCGKTDKGERRQMKQNEGRERRMKTDKRKWRRMTANVDRWKMKANESRWRQTGEDEGECRQI